MSGKCTSISELLPILSVALSSLIVLYTHTYVFIFIVFVLYFCFVLNGGSRKFAVY